MHRQGQGPRALRVRLQGQPGDAGDPVQGRTVRAPRQGAHGNPFDGHTLAAAIADVEKNTGIEVRRIHVDKGYHGHNHGQKFRVWITGQARRVTPTIRREMKRRAAIEPVIGHVKAKHRMGRNSLEVTNGDRVNALLAAVGFNSHLLIRWFAAFLCALSRAALSIKPSQNSA